MQVEFWNTRYAEKAYAYGEKPNVFFAEKINELQPLSLLLPAEGEGRNAVYAAKLGWDVTAFDYSSEGKDKAVSSTEEGVSKIEKALGVENLYSGDPLMARHFESALRVSLPRHGRPRQHFVRSDCLWALHAL